MGAKISPVRINRQVVFDNLSFRFISLLARTKPGTHYNKLVPIGMPKIPKSMLDCVVYLYETEIDARAGKEFGGTGFLVSVPSRHKGQHYVYAVTNHHVACADGASVIRINTLDGQTDVVPYGPENWDFNPALDIACVQIGISPEIYRYAAVSLDHFVTRDILTTSAIGVGDDVFMIGRFVDHDGGLINRPAARLVISV